MSLRVAVIGVGHLGRHHARILSTLPGVELVAVGDTNEPRAREIAAAHGSAPAFDYTDVLGRVDAVTIAVPTELHHAVGMTCVRAGLSVLVEKPMTRSVEEADDLIEAAADAGVT